MRATTGEQGQGEAASFSVVICAEGRDGSLRDTLRSLEYLDYPQLEVCVVCSAPDERIERALADYVGRVKTARAASRALATLRNTGVALAKGQIVAFLDADAIPEPEWLRDLAAAFTGPRVVAAGGFVYDSTGVGYESGFTTIDRLGRQTTQHAVTDDLCFPLSANVPLLPGVGAAIRRDALLAAGGFDEEYAGALDMADLAVRLVDADLDVRLVAGAYVHHGSLQDTLHEIERQDSPASNSWYAGIKDRLYFALRHGQRHFGLSEIIDATREAISAEAQEVEARIGRGELADWDREQFQGQVDDAWRDGMARGLAGAPRLLDSATLRQEAAPFLPFAADTPAGGRRVYCFVSQEYTVAKMGGIGRYTRELASGAAAAGHHTHVITLGQGKDSVTYERGVWVHRVVDRPAHAPQPDGLKMPWYRWSRASTVLETIDAINDRRPVDAVSAPIWDCESIALLGRYPVMTTLLTSMIPWLESNPLRARDRKYLREHARPMIQAETYLMRRSSRIIASTQAILDEMNQYYGMRFEPERLSMIPYGLSDWTTMPREEPPALAPGSLRVVYIGRLEERKGIDVLLTAARRVLARHPHVSLELVGDNTISGPKGRTWQQVFEADPRTAAIRSRVRFHGAVSDERLRGFYAAADIFVAPSRFESFGLILVEGMMFSKP
ncbi:MAG TPA: glycosyltransferase, partial [Ktedonobacterales bacterium]